MKLGVTYRYLIKNVLFKNDHLASDASFVFEPVFISAFISVPFRFLFLLF